MLAIVLARCAPIEARNGRFLDTFRRRMLRRADMLATKNSAPKIVAIFGCAVLAFLTGCTADGPRALISGDELLREGKPAQAILKLEQAARLMPDEPRAWNLLG